MCGVAGLFSGQSKEENLKSRLQKMLDSISHRGPDGQGLWFNKKGLALGHKRLSILDLSPLGAQPMLLEDRYAITYNGEIYNFKEIKKDLEQKGVSFVSNTDTEVILKAVAFYGFSKALSLFRGMFALAVWDSEESRLYMAVDRAGEKPLYYGFVNGDFVFASELKSIVSTAKQNLEINKNALAVYFRHNYIPAPESIYKNIYKLKPGHFISFSEQELMNAQWTEAKPYWTLSPKTKPVFKGSFNEAVESLDELLKEVIGMQMISDVPLGAFLSGGIDSSLVCALMQELGASPVKTFSIGFEDASVNEAQYAKKVADHIGTDHTELYIGEKDCLKWVEKIPEIYCEPFSDSSQIPTCIVSELAKTKVTVSLSGDGADELFNGYTRYFLAEQNFKKLQKIPAWLASFAKPAVDLTPSFLVDGAYAALSNLAGLPNLKSPKSRISLALGQRSQNSFVSFYRDVVSHSQNPERLVSGSVKEKSIFPSLKEMEQMSLSEQMRYIDFHSYLPGDILTKVDRAGMHSSLESRIPFLDHKVIDFAWSLPESFKADQSGGKRILKELLYKYVPRDLLERPKTGFGVPLQSWITKDLKPMIMDLLHPDLLKKQALLNSGAVQNLLDEHYSGKKRNEYLIWDLLVFQLWMQTQ